MAVNKEITPVVERSYPLEQVPDAMRHLQAGKARCKLAIPVADAGGHLRQAAVQLPGFLLAFKAAKVTFRPCAHLPNRPPSLPR